MSGFVSGDEHNDRRVRRACHRRRHHRDPGERPGNRRADSFRNILSNPHVGILYIVPGRTETLRINGRAQLVRDAPFVDDMVVRGHRPELALVVHIDTIFFHCAKAFLRSDLWKPETWDSAALPRHACIVKDIQDIPETLEQLDGRRCVI